MKKFTPQFFLSALGAGGISVSGFAFLNYTIEHGKGLITYSQLHAKNLSPLEILFYGFFESYMAIFAIIHFFLMLILLRKYFSWKKTSTYIETKNNPIASGSLLIIFLALFMSLNVVIGVVRYFVPFLSENFQAIIPYGFSAWLILWLMLMWQEIKLFASSITEKYDFEKINFSWMLHPFSLSMATVTGTGIAAMANNQFFASTSAFLSMISLTMALFLIMLKSTSLSRNYFSASTLPEKQYLPSMLNFIPIATVLGISFFRLGHYFEKNFNAHIEPFFVIITTLTLAFETWYLAFGLYLLRDYFKKELSKDFHFSQWSLVCPLVAYAVMGSFTYFTFFQNPLFIWLITFVTIIFLVLYFYLLTRQIKQWLKEK